MRDHLGVPYDDLQPQDQERERARWDRDIDRRLDRLNLVELFERSGQAYVELDDTGQVVWHRP